MNKNFIGAGLVQQKLPTQIISIGININHDLMLTRKNSS